MVLDLCRVTVRTCRFGTSTAVDLTLPTSPELGEILSAIVDLVGVGHETADGVPERLRLARVDGSALDESVSLLENGIRDGDVLLLAAEPIPRPEQHSEDPASMPSKCQPRLTVVRHGRTQWARLRVGGRRASVRRRWHGPVPQRLAPAPSSRLSW